MALLSLANELLLAIAENLTHESDINAFAQTSRRVYFSVNFFLYRFSVQRRNNSALRWAALHGFFPIVRMLLDIGANVRTTVRNSEHRTALHLASAEGHLSIEEALIQSGAEVNAAASDGTTPLHEAVWGGFYDVTLVLLERGADFMKVLSYSNRSTVLHLACYFGYTGIVQLLLERGVGIEVKDGKMRTPLHYAIDVEEKFEERFWYGNLRTVEFLLQQNANRDAWDISNQRPKDLAKKHPCTIVEILFQNTLDIRVDEAIQLEHRLRIKKEQEQAKIRKMEELATERALKRIARLNKEASKLEQEERREKINEVEEDSDRAERQKLAELSRRQKQDMFRQHWSQIRVEADKERLHKESEAARKQQLLKITSILTSEKQDAARYNWAKIKADAEERSHQFSKASSQPTCMHPALGWLKCKGRSRCDRCGRQCTKYSFKCGDCRLGVCFVCKANGAHFDT